MYSLTYTAFDKGSCLTMWLLNNNRLSKANNVGVKMHFNENYIA